MTRSSAARRCCTAAPPPSSMSPTACPPGRRPTSREEVRSTRQAESSPGLGVAVERGATAYRWGSGTWSPGRRWRRSATRLCEVIGAAGAGRVFLPAYQRGHPDHDASYLAGALARERLPRGRETGTWWVYGLYGFDPERRLRFGWLPPGPVRPVRGPGRRGSARGQRARPAPASPARCGRDPPWTCGCASRPPSGSPRSRPGGTSCPALPCFYDEELQFGRHGASMEVVESAFHRVLAARSAAEASACRSVAR